MLNTACLKLVYVSTARFKLESSCTRTITTHTAVRGGWLRSVEYKNLQGPGPPTTGGPGGHGPSTFLQKCNSKIC